MNDSTPTRYRVHGGVELTLPVPADTAHAALAATPPAAAALFAAMPTARLEPRMDILAVEPVDAGQPAAGYRASVRVYGYLDVTADDPGEAIDLAEQILHETLAAPGIQLIQADSGGVDRWNDTAQEPATP